jgi:deoxyribose-phosphate aldolase
MITINMVEANLIKIEDISIEQLASICDHTFLNRSEAFKHVAKKGQSSIKLRSVSFQQFLEKTINLRFLPFSVCVRPEEVSHTVKFLKDNNRSRIKVASVIGFPDGSLYGTDFKVAETNLAIDHGADEIDMVLNILKFKEGDFNFVKEDINAVVTAAHAKGAIVKLILENSELNLEETRKICELANETNLDFVKTSTGFSGSGAKFEDLKVMRDVFKKGVKMSGGVKMMNVKELLTAVSGRTDGLIELNPNKIRIGESSLLSGAKADY